MKLDVTQILVGFDGKNVQQVDEDKEKDKDGRPAMKDMDLRSACCTALMQTAGANQKAELAGDEKLRRFELARRIHKEDPVQLKVEELALVKKLIGELFVINVVGPAWSLLEGEEEDVEDKA